MSRMSYRNRDNERIVFERLSETCDDLCQAISDVVTVLDSLDLTKPHAASIVRIIQAVMRTAQGKARYITPIVPVQLGRIKVSVAQALRKS